MYFILFSERNSFGILATDELNKNLEKMLERKISTACEFDSNMDFFLQDMFREIDSIGNKHFKKGCRERVQKYKRS